MIAQSSIPVFTPTSTDTVSSRHAVLRPLAFVWNPAHSTFSCPHSRQPFETHSAVHTVLYVLICIPSHRTDISPRLVLLRQIITFRSIVRFLHNSHQLTHNPLHICTATTCSKHFSLSTYTFLSFTQSKLFECNQFFQLYTITTYTEL